MKEISPIRVWITGGTPDDREHVRNALREEQIAVVGDGEPAVELPFGNSGPGAKQHALDASAQSVSNSDERATAERAVRESQRLISIGRLSAEIVHEINNPLESVGNLLYLALHEPGLPEKAVEFLRHADSELQRVVQISKQTLSFSRESAVPIPLHVADLMNEVVTMYGRRIRQKQIHLAEEYGKTGTIVAVPGEIRQVFSNLVTNAIEASSKGGKLSIRIRNRQRSSGDGVQITVCDNGVGIAASVRKRIGEIFFTTKGDSGTGLGLWVTKAIVARHGGSMRLHSSTGRHHGTAFSVFLPTTKPERSSKTGGETRDVQVNGNVTEISRHPKHSTNVLHAPTLTLPVSSTRQRKV